MRPYIIFLALVVMAGFTRKAPADEKGDYYLEGYDRDEIGFIYDLGYGPRLERILAKATATTKSVLGGSSTLLLDSRPERKLQFAPRYNRFQGAEKAASYEYNGIQYSFSSDLPLPKLMMKNLTSSAETREVALSSLPSINRIDSRHGYQILSANPRLGKLLYAIYEKQGFNDVAIYSYDFTDRAEEKVYECRNCFYNLKYVTYRLGAWIGEGPEFLLAGDYSKKKAASLVRIKFEEGQRARAREEGLYNDAISFTNLTVNQGAGMLTGDSKFLVIDSMSRGNRFNKIVSAQTGKTLYSGFERASDGFVFDFGIYAENGEFVRIFGRDIRRASMQKLSCDSVSCKGGKTYSGPKMDFLSEMDPSAFDYNLIPTSERVFALIFRNMKPEVVSFEFATERVRTVVLPLKSDAFWVGFQDEGKSILFLAKNEVMERFLVALNSESLAVEEMVNVENNPFTDYSSEVLSARSKDGIQVPVTLIKRKGSPLTSRTPLVVYAYGEYGTPGFAIWMSRNHFAPLLRAGYAIAVAHVRGGGDKGIDWYRAGSLFHKQKGLEDFESALRELHKKDVSSPRYTAIKGFSAGGTMISVALAKFPSLFHMAILEWPVTDALNMTQDTRSFLAGPESLAPVGNPQESSTARELIWNRSGLQLLRPSPHKKVVWISTSDNDLQVAPWFPLGYQTKLKRLGFESYLYSVEKGGHLGSENGAENLNALSLQYSLLQREMSKD